MKESYLEKRIIVYVISLFMLMLFSNGCGRILGHYGKGLVDDLANGLVVSLKQQKDIVLTEQGVPTILLVIDGLIENSPENKKLLYTGAQTYSAYTTFFVGKKNPERHKILIEKARGYAFRALSLHSKEFAAVKDKTYTEFISCLPSFEKEDVPYLFTVAGCWAGWIVANTDSFDAVADIPKVVNILKRVIGLDETHNYGAAHTLLGASLCLFPASLGGKPEAARKHFERAIEIGQGKFLPTYVAFAGQYAKLVYDEELFFDLLNTVLASPVDAIPDLTVPNILAQKSARAMIDEAREDEYFD